MAIRLAIAAIVALAIGCVLDLRHRRFDRWEIDGTSMLPCLHPGDWVIVETATRARRPLRTGDVVLVPDPRDARRMLVKRVVHLGEGDRAWLEGDNPAESTDSRQFGPVRAHDIVGRVIFRYHPIGRLGRVR